ncbi:EF-P lysine aminoacylase EpmA [Umboniibacter marinipuniceus]|uniref:Lysyl-tRNA synthetase class 2 n=1 Tax=Umboniibacter marinipuniceus TaxID=569599 RepID=A0A3M0AHT6_9GAMM|nr:EF-P lysine aminoacylase EpmA [Umboniibacter marinipuniceus]RMA82328.1 lysyl-tRNA synthetase class 2 [Umboniibacter marinipuniceus]
MVSWRPTASLQSLQQRAKILADIRQFLAKRGILEIEVPLLSAAGGTDLNIELLKIEGEDRWLASSPEFPLKRLVAAGYGDVYALQKVFRKGESGRRHNSEFTMLEWYRVGFDEFQLMDEVEALCQAVFNMPAATQVSYRKLFIDSVNLDPFTINDTELAAVGAGLSGLDPTALARDGWLDVIFSHAIEPELDAPVFIFDFPASQSALAKITNRDYGQVAQRFELVYQGVELANGYFELTDGEEQRQRFERELALRAHQKKAVVAMDEHLIAALNSAMPSCAGVAMGVDRICMLAAATQTLSEVISFDDNNA